MIYCVDWICLFVNRNTECKVKMLVFEMKIKQIITLSMHAMITILEAISNILLVVMTIVLIVTISKMKLITKMFLIIQIWLI